MIERQIVIGLIVSSKFIEQIRTVFNPYLLESSAARFLARWCLEYYDRYKEAPKSNIQGLIHQYANEGVSKDIIEEIEEDILPGLSKEYEEGDVNVDYLVDITKNHLNVRGLLIHSEKIKTLIARNKVIEAENLASQFKPILKENPQWTDVGTDKSIQEIKDSLSQSQECLIRYPGALGEMWNGQMVREGFVALMGMEKRGKTFFLIDMAMRAAIQRRNVAFFAAGDMSEKQMLNRFAIYLTKKSNKEEYCNAMFEPVKDCIFNQTDSCSKDVRECDFGIFPDKSPQEIRNEITMEELTQKYKDFPDYRPCTNCLEFKKNPWGTVWIKQLPSVQPLTVEEASEKLKEFYEKGHRLRLSSHPTHTLSVSQIKSILEIWEKQDNFVPDVLVIDYADILIEENVKEFRHQQNSIWMGLRSLSQAKHCLVITATQTDADSYNKSLLKWTNFSEDKRKYAHVTAMYGLNQDPEGREKKLKILRINEIVVREGDFNVSNQVKVDRKSVV